MGDITVAEASGLIAAVVFLVQLFIPLAVSFTLVALLNEEETAVTWSVVGRLLQSTYWPLILGSDTTANTGVRRTVKCFAYFLPGALALLALASVVTPLGLYDTIAPAPDKVLMDFEYAKDLTVMGFTTQQRSPLDFNRYCGGFALIPCPGSNTIIEDKVIDGFTHQILPYGYNATVPQNLTSAFDSGRERYNSSVSSIWDIQWRSYLTKRDQDVNNGSARITGVYRPLQMMILDDDVKLVEGNVVDARQGGIGFRNHTVPRNPGNGITWSEDLLWIQPENSCVDTNLTLDFTLGGTSDESIARLVLTDHGGFVDVTHEYPYINYSNPQKELDVARHAYKGAALSNIWTMFYMNVTNPANETVNRSSFNFLDSYEGKSFVLPNDTLYLNPRKIGTSALSAILSSLSMSKLYSNPWNISAEEVCKYTSRDCELAHGGDPLNINSISMSCGLVYGTARSTGNQDRFSYSPGTNWTMPLYSCAAASKALIKTVHFSYNGTNGLRDLRVLDIQDKQYARDEDRPYWGVEHRDDIILSDATPLWGLVSPEFQNNPGISVIQSEHLWLTGKPSLLSIAQSVDNIPAMHFHSKAMDAAFNLKEADWGSLETYDYSGSIDAGMFRKWENLTASASSASRIISLIWTDIAANAVVGTRAWDWSMRPPSFAAKNDKPPGSTLQLLVTPWDRNIQYHPVYAIPAILVAVIVALLVGGVLIAVILGRAAPAKMRRYLNHTSVGRTLMVFLSSDDVYRHAMTSGWISRAGVKPVDLSGLVPRVSETEEDHQPHSHLLKP
ncbi:hypothetical protein BDV59DRAFT_202088 [Aspergillus ambiguus]|uniref:uncharacterized protein n=1 Tax=Aspergillus ambiguus TaxID=176160 RepID=UPI003CCCACD9